MAGKNLVLECPLSDGHPLVDELTVSPDPDSDGVFILDPHFGPKWRLVSTRDATIVHLPKSIEKITVLQERDDILGCHKMKVEFKSGQSPLEGGETSYVCCFPTDKVLQDQSRVFHGSERTASTRRGECQNNILKMKLSSSESHHVIQHVLLNNTCIFYC